jgi:hypothetical protein
MSARLEELRCRPDVIAAMHVHEKHQELFRAGVLVCCAGERRFTAKVGPTVVSSASRAALCDMALQLLLLYEHVGPVSSAAVPAGEAQ